MEVRGELDPVRIVGLRHGLENPFRREVVAARHGFVDMHVAAKIP